MGPSPRTSSSRRGSASSEPVVHCPRPAPQSVNAEERRGTEPHTVLDHGLQSRTRPRAWSEQRTGAEERPVGLRPSPLRQLKKTTKCPCRASLAATAGSTTTDSTSRVGPACPCGQQIEARGRRPSGRADRVGDDVLTRCGSIHSPVKSDESVCSRGGLPARACPRGAAGPLLVSRQAAKPQSGRRLTDGAWAFRRRASRCHPRGAAPEVHQLAVLHPDPEQPAAHPDLRAPRAPLFAAPRLGASDDRLGPAQTRSKGHMAGPSPPRDHIWRRRCPSPRDSTRGETGQRSRDSRWFHGTGSRGTWESPPLPPPSRSSVLAFLPLWLDP